VRHVPIGTVEYLVNEESFYTSWDIPKEEALRLKREAAAQRR
jgi:hypothetical protein